MKISLKFQKGIISIEPYFQLGLSDFWRDGDEYLKKPFTIGVMLHYTF